MFIELLLICFISYIFGSIPSGYIIGKLKGVDLRSKGSGNIGASNAFRVLGKKEGIMTLLFDMLKGFIPTILIWIFFKNQNFTELGALFTVLGHDFSVFLKFRGGKGVATSYGVSLFFSIYSLIGIFLWIAILKLTKYASLASILSFLVVTTIIFFINNNAKFLFLVLFILILIKHYQNIKRLVLGQEHTITGGN
jgi:glycerol-3-phosphate acyltransferase PlsY